MIKNFLSLTFLLLVLSANSQTENSELNNSFEQKGLRLITKTELPTEKINLILNFNFEEYRKLDKSIIIKITDGPHLELYSKYRVESGEKDQIPVEKSSPEHLEDDHGHILPKMTSVYEIIPVDVYGTSTNKTN